MLNSQDDQQPVVEAVCVRVILLATSLAIGLGTSLGIGLGTSLGIGLGIVKSKKAPAARAAGAATAA
ncbi:hypothetical protein [Limnohabitans sp.]|uniref:hypothetical protein n=1 Tax=Limnohabitans sp. TaxID=1907725 RepID=UPI0037C024B4